MNVSVLIVAPLPPPYGGMALQATALVERLRKDGINVELLATNPPPGRLLGRIKGIRTIVQSLLFLSNLIRALSRRRIVHLLGASHWYFFLRVLPTMVGGRLFGRQVILNYRGGEAPMFFARYRWLVLPILRLAQSIVVPSKYLERIFQAYGQRPKVIPNFVDLELFRFRCRDLLKPNLLVTRSLEPLYNIRMALDTFALVQKLHPEARIDVVGSGSEELALKTYVRQQGWSGVYFHGAVANETIAGYLDKADILLNPSNADNMPINLLEAFAAGVPVVTTNVGGIPDLVGDSEAVLLVNPNDPTAMAACVEKLLAQPQTAAWMTQQASVLCEQMSWDSVGRLWLDLYSAVEPVGAIESKNRIDVPTI
jgi:phenylacetate-CoA ligase